MSTISSGVNPTKSIDITFQTGKELQFFQTLRNRVDAYFTEHHLSKNANATMVIKTIILLSAYLIPFAAIVFIPMHFALAMLLWVVLGMATAGIGMSVMHDANHGAYSSNERVNRMLGLALNLVGGSIYNWKVQHNMLHHTYTNITGLDEDIATQTFLRFSPHAPHKQIQRGQWWYAFFFYGILSLYWVLAKDMVKYASYKKRGFLYSTPSKNTWFLIRVILLKIVYFGVLIGLPTIMGVPVMQVIAGFVLMHMTCGLILSVIFQLAHSVEGTDHPMPDEGGNMKDSWAVHQLRTTMNFARHNKWLSWYVGGLNFQVEHHLFTRICHVHYPAIAPIVKQTAEEFGVPYLEYRTFGEAFRSHIRLLKTYGRTPLDEIMG